MEKSPCAYAKAAADFDAVTAGAGCCCCCCCDVTLLASLEGSGEAVSPAARERFDARDGDEEGEGSRCSLGRGLLPALPLLPAPPPSFFLLLLAPSPTAEGGTGPARARKKAGRMGCAKNAGALLVDVCQSMEDEKK